MNSLNNIVPWLTAASISIALLSVISSVVDLIRRRKRDGVTDIEQIRQRYASISKSIDAFEEDIVGQIEISMRYGDSSEKLKTYTALIEKNASIRTLLAEEAYNLKEVKKASIQQEIINLYQRIVGRLGGTQKLLDILHDRIVRLHS